MGEYRASFDATIEFSNGGDLTVHGVRVDVPSADVSGAEIGALAALDVRGAAVLLHTPATTPGSAHRPTPKNAIFSPGQAPPG